jgi:hypothetical protein
VTKALQIINRAAEILGYKDPSEPLDGTDADNFLGVLNSMVDAWALDSLFVYATTELVQSVSGSPVAIGPGAAIDTARPVRIASGGFFRVGGNDRPFRMVERDEFAQITQKTATGQPQVCYYEADAPTAALYFWPVLSAAQELHLPLPKRLSAFANLTTDYTLPAGYQAALEYSLAEELAPGRRPAAAEVVRRAINLRRAIRTVNLGVPQLDSELAPARSPSLLLS